MALELGSPFSHHMVLQRGRRNALWGWDRPGETLVVRVVRVDGAREPVTLYAKASAQGEFRVDLPELEAGATHRIYVTGSSEVTVDDVLVGEVWLASGQSNMEWTVAQASDAEATIAGADDPQIRWLRVARRPSIMPARKVEASWRVVDRSNVEGMTAVGYAFARALRERLRIPVGIVDASWGGTPIESWTSLDALLVMDPDVDERIGTLEASSEEIERLRAAHGAAVLRWELEALPRDPGNRGEPEGWASPSFDAASWPSMRLPEYWQRQKLEFNGVVWFRRTVNVPAEWEGRDLVLELGAIDDFDRTYLNGEVVGEHPQGTPGAFQIRRVYRVPARLVHPGENVLAVRVFDHAGQGGFAGPASAMMLSREGERERGIPLAGPWQYRVEHEIAPVPSTVWSTMPPAPPALNPHYVPGSLYGGMIAPILPYGMGGVLWYQGESNVAGHSEYRAQLIALIRDWRTRLGQGQIPFYLVQLAAFAATPEWAYLREAQAQACSEPATEMVTAIDIGDPMDVHPTNKREVGRRLAALALAEHFGFGDVAAHGPRLSRVDMIAGAARVRFAHAAGLHTTDGGPVRGFQLAGHDLVFHEAEGRIDGDTVTLTAPSVPAPAAVRYAFSDCPRLNLVNAAELPAEPFRTDCA